MGLVAQVVEHVLSIKYYTYNTKFRFLVAVVTGSSPVQPPKKLIQNKKLWQQQKFYLVPVSQTFRTKLMEKECVFSILAKETKRKRHIVQFVESQLICNYDYLFSYRQNKS